MSSSYQLCLSSHFHWYDAEKIELFQIHLVVLLWDFQNYFADFQTLHHLDSRMWHAAKKKTRLKAIKSTYEMHILVPKIEQRFQICLVLNQFQNKAAIFGEPTKLFWWICSNRKLNWIFLCLIKNWAFQFRVQKRKERTTKDLIKRPEVKTRQQPDLLLWWY